jgi:hypothetical protein
MSPPRRDHARALTDGAGRDYRAGLSVTCPGCGADVDATSRFCADCGAALGRRCPECAEPVDAAKRFCAHCGAALAREAGPPAPDAEGEHKPVTVLFCDIVGSTSIAERIGAEAMHALLSRLSLEAPDRSSRPAGPLARVASQKL